MVFDRPKVQTALLAALETQGIDCAALARVIKEGLDAQKQLVSGGATITTPDHAARWRFLQGPDRDQRLGEHGELSSSP